MATSTPLNTETFSTPITPKAKRKGKQAIEKTNTVLERLEVQYVSVDDISPNTYNPNRQSDHDFELLCKSMSEDGFTQPIVAVKSKPGASKPFVVVDGEHRWRAAQTIGLTSVPIVVVPMSEEQAKIATLRHNRARGSEDVELSAALLRDLRELGALEWAADSLSLDDVELERLLNDIPTPDALAGDEFSEAWEPGERTEDNDSSYGTSNTVRVEGMTAAAVEALNDQNKRLAEAKTSEDRFKARQETDVYRLNLTFSGDEAKVIRTVLKNSPADRVLAMCLAAQSGTSVSFTD